MIETKESMHVDVTNKKSSHGVQPVVA